MGLFVRTIGLPRATTKIGLANLVTNMRRLLWLEAPLGARLTRGVAARALRPRLSAQPAT